MANGIRFLLLAALLALGALVQVQAQAQDKAQDRKGEAKERVEYEKKTVINFDDDTIQGDLTRPDGEYVESRRRVGHSNLIKIREEWRDKVKQAAAGM